MIRLELPNIKYKESFIKAVKEFKADLHSHHIASIKTYINIPVDDLEKNIENILFIKLDNIRNGIDLPDGWVPATEYWIIDENNNYVGTGVLRHRLSSYLEKMGGHIGYEIVPSYRQKGHAKNALKLLLKEANKMGVNKALVTCIATNNPARACIESVKREVGGEVLIPSDTGNINLRFLLDTTT